MAFLEFPNFSFEKAGELKKKKKNPSFREKNTNRERQNVNFGLDGK